MFGSCADCLWELGSNFLLLLQGAQTRNVETQLRNTVLSQKLVCYFLGCLQLSKSLEKKQPCSGTQTLTSHLGRDLFLSLGDIYLISKISILQKKKIILFPSFFFTLFPVFFFHKTDGIFPGQAVHIPGCNRMPWAFFSSFSTSGVVRALN